MDTPILTPEQQEDVETRIKEFRERYLELVTQFDVDFVSYPQYVQVGPNVYGTYNGMHIVDKKYAPIPSPLNDEM